MSGKKSEKELEHNREYQKGYYADNRVEILAKRREKYKNDPTYKSSSRARDLRNYWFRQREENAPDKALPEVSFEGVSPKGHVEIVVDNQNDVRHGQTVKVAVYGTPELGTFLGRDPQTIRKWLKSGVIPEPSIRGDALPEGHVLKRGRAQRLYTEDEARALYGCRDLLSRPFLRIADSHFAQCVRDGFSVLIQGLEVRTKKMTLRMPKESQITGTCIACNKPFVGVGNPSDHHHCRSCGFRVKMDPS